MVIIADFRTKDGIKMQFKILFLVVIVVMAFFAAWGRDNVEFKLKNGLSEISIKGQAGRNLASQPLAIKTGQREEKANISTAGDKSPAINSTGDSSKITIHY